VDNFSSQSDNVFGSQSAVEPASYVVLPASADFTGNDFPGLSDNSFSAPGNEFSADGLTGNTNVPSDDYGSPSTTVTGSAGDGYGAPSVADNFPSLEADYTDVPVYDPLDTNSLEAGLGQPQFLDSYAEDAPLSSYVEVSSLDDGFSSSLDSFDPVPDTGYSAPDPVLDEVYDDSLGDEVPSYLIPQDIYQASPSISVQFASPRDTRNIDLETEAAEAVKAAFEQSLVIDLTSEDYPDPAPVYGARLGRSSHGSASSVLSRLSQLRAIRRRRHR